MYGRQRERKREKIATGNMWRRREQFLCGVVEGSGRLPSTVQ